MQPDLRNPKVGDRVLVHPDTFDRQPTPAEGMVELVDHRNLRYFVQLGEANDFSAAYLDKSQFNLHPDSLR